MSPQRPLAGVRVVVTRAADQATELVDRFVALGADVVSAPSIAIEPRGDRALLAAALESPDIAVVAVTSPNGAKALLDAGVPARPSLAAVGRSTAAVLERAGHPVSVVPERQTAADLAKAIGPGAGAVFFVAAEGAGPDLEDGLARAGRTVIRHDAYATVRVRPSATIVRSAGRCGFVTFASGSAVRAWNEVERVVLPAVSIGPSTTSVAESLGIEVVAEADPHNLDGLVQAVVGVVEASS